MLKRLGSGLREASSTAFFSGNPNMTSIDDADARMTSIDDADARES